MRLLLDTHALLWFLAGDRRLGKAAEAAIANPENEVFVSVVSLWEIVVKQRIGKLEVDLPALFEAIEPFDRLGIEVAHLLALSGLVQHHRDPFDHFLIAQARAEGLSFVTADGNAGLYDVAVFPCG